jgi:hypothetical protein
MSDYDRERQIARFAPRAGEATDGRTIATPETLTLSTRDPETFVSAILAPPKPGPVLRAAACRYKKSMGL